MADGSDPHGSVFRKCRDDPLDEQVGAWCSIHHLVTKKVREARLFDGLECSGEARDRPHHSARRHTGATSVLVVLALCAGQLMPRIKRPQDAGICSSDNLWEQPEGPFPSAGIEQFRTMG